MCFNASETSLTLLNCKTQVYIAGVYTCRLTSPHHHNHPPTSSCYLSPSHAPPTLIVMAGSARLSTVMCSLSLLRVGLQEEHSGPVVHVGDGDGWLGPQEASAFRHTIHLWLELHEVTASSNVSVAYGALAERREVCNAVKPTVMTPY